MKKAREDVMANEIGRKVERLPDFTQERIQWSIDDIGNREVDPRTGAPSTVKLLFDYWQEQRVGALPAAVSFDPKGAMTPDAFRFVAWVDVRASDPLDFMLRHHPGMLYGDWSDKRLRDYHNEKHAYNCALEYLTCKVVQKPHYYEIKQTIGKMSRHYTRLLLPVLDRNRNVGRLYYGVNLIHHAGFGPAIESRGA